MFCVFPLVLLAYFNQPSADDFCYNTASQNLSYLETQIKLFTTLNGRYTTSAILSIPVFLSYNLFLYKLMPILMLIFVFYALYYLASSLFLNLRRRDYIVLSLSCLSIYIVQMPSVSQGFYWLSSAVSYQLSSVFVLLLFSLVVKILYFNKIKYIIVSVPLIILVIGSNEIAMLITDFLLGIIFLFSIFKTRKVNLGLLFLLVLAAVLSFIVTKSQGNNLRGDSLSNSHMLFCSIFKTLNILKSYLIIWLPIIIVFLLIFFDFLNRKVSLKISKVFDVPPVMVLLVAIAVTFIGFFAGYWALGSLLPPRAINLIYFFFILIFLYFTLVLFFYFTKKNKDFITFSSRVLYLLFVCLIFLIAQKDNIKTAYSDLFSGKAYKYDLQLKKRYQFIRNCKTDTIYVSEIKYKPKTLFVEDINTDNQYWLNGCYNAFFNKSKILIRSDKE